MIQRTGIVNWLDEGLIKASMTQCQSQNFDFIDRWILLAIAKFQFCDGQIMFTIAVFDVSHG